MAPSAGAGGGASPRVRKPKDVGPAAQAALAALGFPAAARLDSILVEPKELADAMQILGRVTPEELQVARA
eukprot:5443368-Pyramimonas_sp.AAC.1